ncbi:hypothetical protein TVAG_280910 [Trichomonas vaginalis G3]|uniref:Uncharacterized protein n=1 Tax=Trichomonas vaginalis (strain ATCC PRA-98 / G3) TaxID=412133 RepID=A2DRL1_TRIV3|nr:pectin lyase-like family [Trichomonas vaginalis G3]EAY16974.1 hypothetical protein TVAG_280910 [Trichomonas vaginalis G3]KAI5508979.1 pectin lyase-like family [Trichomonas vaginalis G3]|eukprot:XP_001329197.1 hypothetical protein [Trichomonas vaginalis G3]
MTNYNKESYFKISIITLLFCSISPYIFCSINAFSLSQIAKFRLNRLHTMKFQNLTFKNASSYKESKDYSILDCVFKNIHVNSSSPLEIVLSNAEFKLARSGFLKCSSETSSGALFLNSFTYIVEESCFFSCFSHSRGQALSLQLSSIDYCMFSKNSISNCDPGKYKGADVTFLINDGSHQISYLNSTKNNIFDIEACLCCLNPRNLNIHYSNFAKNDSFNLIWLFGTFSKDSFSACNIIQNTSPKDNSTSIFAVEKGNITLSGIVFLKNNFDTYFLMGDYAFSLCVFDVKNSSSLYSSATATFENCVFALPKANSRQIPTNNQYKCFALGAPEPKEQFPIQESLEFDDSSGIGLFCVIVGVGITTGVIGFYGFKLTFKEDEEELTEDMKST